jgi:hypothetical protein
MATDLITFGPPELPFDINGGRSTRITKSGTD